MRKMLLGCMLVLSCTLLQAQESPSIQVLFDNDVHCYAEGYPVLAGVADSLRAEGHPVLIVSNGDYVFGNTLGVVSEGAYIIRLMNTVGYDYATLGNHEFDYGIARLKELQAKSRFEIVCCNFVDSHGNPLMTTGALREINGVKIGFVGVATPTTITATNPSYFRDATGHQVYDFCSKNLVDVVQKIVDSLRSEGADVVVVLSHLGDSDSEPTSVKLIHSTTGIDVVLDGHDHHVIAQRWEGNKSGEPVLLSSTGEYLKYIGLLTITPFAGRRPIVTTHLLNTYEQKLAGRINRSVADTLATIKQQYKRGNSEIFAHAEISLTAIDERGMRIARYEESNLGNLVADAFRSATGAQIGWVNGGSLRANLDTGDISANELMRVLPFQNRMILAEVTGQDILDALEMSVHALPESYGGFAQVSGLSYEVRCDIPSPVVLDSNNIIDHVEGTRRVSNVRIITAKGSEPLKANKIYTIGSTNFTLCNQGDGMIFPHLRIVRDDFGPEVKVVEKYIKEQLGGKIGKEQEAIKGRLKKK